MLFWPGYIGLNNLKKTDYLNAVLQGLTKVGPLRDFCLKFKDEKVDALTQAGSSNLGPK